MKDCLRLDKTGQGAKRALFLSADFSATGKQRADARGNASRHADEAENMLGVVCANHHFVGVPAGEDLPSRLQQLDAHSSMHIKSDSASPKSPKVRYISRDLPRGPLTSPVIRVERKRKRGAVKGAPRISAKPTTIVGARTWSAKAKASRRISSDAGGGRT